MKHIIFGGFWLATLFGYNYHGCYLAPDHLTGWVACLDTALVFKTTDGGQTWVLQNLPSGKKVIYDITGTDPNHAWTSGDLGQVMYTNNGGQNWIIQPINLSKNATRIQFLDTLIGWVIGGNGTIGRTTDGGASWEQNFSPHYAAEYYGLSFIDHDRGWIVAGYPDSLVTRQGYIDRSTDGGVNWDSLYQSSGYEDYFDVEFLNTDDGIVVGGNDSTYAAIILKSTNGGISWFQVSPPASTYYLRALDFHGAKGWAVGRFGSIIHTTDAGNSWFFQANPATSTLFDVDFSDSLHGIACGQNIILYTTNGGQTWNPSVVSETSPVQAKSRITLRVEPNPARRSIKLSVDHSENQRELQIFDSMGRRLRSFTLLPKCSVLYWDLRDCYRRRVPAGVYIVRASNRDAFIQINVVIIE